MAYCPGDKVFAKVKGFPHWPCRINLLPPDVSVPKGKYPIFFYGTHEVYFLGPKDLFPYEQFKHKYGVERNKPAFQAGLREILENPDVLFLGKDPDAEAFLARFYKFIPTGQNGPSVPTGKRPCASPLSEQSHPAKRLHAEPSVEPAKKKTPAAKTEKSVAKKAVSAPSTPIELKDKFPAVQPRSVPKPASSQEVTTSARRSLPKRVSSLRLRIRKGANGLQFAAPDSALSPMSPTITTESSSTLEQSMVSEDQKPLPIDPLRITIKQITVTSALSQSSASSPPSRPIFSVTPASTVSTLLGVGSDSAPVSQKKSTAVVTPLRRGQVPVDNDADGNALTPSFPECKSLEKPESKSPGARGSKPRTRLTRVAHAHDLRKNHHSKRSEKLRSPSSLPLVVDSVGSETGSGSTSTPQTPNEFTRTNMNTTSAANRDRSPVATSKSPSTMATISPPKSPNVKLSTENLLNTSRKQQEQQLKDLDTEARLLLIDRSIKSSLVRDHEDIRTCVDRLEMLDRISLTLPMLAKCWTLVETIGKCRRYKRSMEVKIAAQKVFNKFLQLYSTADKYELDTAVAELSRHQQRHVKQLGARPSDTNTQIPPYTGPKTLAELFQVSVGVLSDRKRQPPMADQFGDQSPATSSKSLGHVYVSKPYKPSSTPSPSVLSNRDHYERGSRHRGSKLDIGDIPLPEEKNANLSDPAAHIIHPENFVKATQPEEEYEVLDEYEDSGDSKGFMTHYSEGEQKTPYTFQGPTTVPMVETQIIPYSMVPPHLIPPSYCLEDALSDCPTLIHSSLHTSLPNSVSRSFGAPYSHAPSQHDNSEALLPVSDSASINVSRPLNPSDYHFAHASDQLGIIDRPSPTRRLPDNNNSSHTRELHGSPSSSSPVRSTSSIRSNDTGRPPRSHTSRPLKSHRARSPHELPHPLEHYQRCLTSALKVGNTDSVRQVQRHRCASDSDRKLLPPQNTTMRLLGACVKAKQQPSALPTTACEDLDTRIARIIGAVSSNQPRQSTSSRIPDLPEKNLPHPMGSPPPPPPPPPLISQRVLFTHRPQLSCCSSNTPSVASKPCDPVEFTYSASAATVPLESPLLPRTHFPLVDKALAKPPLDMPAGTNLAPPSDRPNNVQPGPPVTNCEEDREIYSLLGV